MKVQVRLNNYRRSASKVRRVANVIKGLPVGQAENQLTVLQNGSSEDLRKLLLSGVAAAKNNFQLDENTLFVENLVVQEGRVLKRWRPRAYGRAARILKRTCHVVLTLTSSLDDSKKGKSASDGDKKERRVVKEVSEGKKRSDKESVSAGKKSVEKSEKTNQSLTGAEDEKKKKGEDKDSKTKTADNNNKK